MSVCRFGEMIGDEGPLVCRSWYEPVECALPSITGPFTGTQRYRWTHSQPRCANLPIRATKCPGCRSHAAHVCPRCR